MNTAVYDIQPDLFSEALYFLKEGQAIRLFISSPHPPNVCSLRAVWIMPFKREISMQAKYVFSLFLVPHLIGLKLTKIQ